MSIKHERILVVAFTVRPEEGSEGGVGWIWLNTIASFAEERGMAIDLVFDARDSRYVVGRLQSRPGIHLHPVPMPRVAERLARGRRTRLSYLAWWSRAYRATKSLDRQYSYAAAHQVNFATATMPSVLGATTAPVRVWGPVTLPILPRAKLSTRSIPRSWTSWGETIRAWSARLLAFTWPHLAKSATLVLAQNPRTAELIDNWSQIPAVVWPNLVLDWGTGQAGDGQTRDARLILCAGRLVGLKNQRHAISLLSSSSLSDFRLEIVGDGPLRDELYRLAQQIGVSDRVVFSGSLSREALLKRMDRAAVLVHPSIREGLGWVVGEATARGLPVAVTAGTGAEFALEWSNGPGKALPLTGDTSSDVEVWSSAVAELAGSGPYRPSERWSSERLRRQLAEWYGLHNAP